MADRSRTTSSSAHTHSSESEDIYSELQLSERPQSRWKCMKRIVERRPRGWISRFADRLDENQIVPPVLDYMDKRMLRLQKNGWKNVEFRGISPNREEYPDILQQRISMFDKPDLRVTACCYCWVNAPIGVRSIYCSYCNVVAHRDCALTVPLLPTINSNNKERPEQQELTDDWLCPFCREEVTNYESTYNNRYSKKRMEFERHCAAVKIQSFVRMLVMRIPYTKCRTGLIRFQRIIRAVQFGKKQELERAKDLRPFRIRIHSIQAFRLTPAYLQHLESQGAIDSFPLTFTEHSKLGEMKATVYDNYFGADSKYQSADASQPFVNIVREGHTYQPVYLKSFRGSKSFKKGHLFLTLTIHEADESNGDDSDNKRCRQLYRFDCPLKEQEEELCLESYLKSKGIKVDKHHIDILKRKYHFKSFVANHPYIMIPACKSNIQVRLTLSEVCEWPRALLLGQAKLKNISPYLFWKQSATFCDLFQGCNWMDVPDIDEGCKLNIVFRMVHHNAKSIEAKPMLKETSIALVSWTLLTFSDEEENSADYANIYQDEAMLLSKKRVWAILQDRALLLYAPTGKSTYPHTVIDLRKMTVYACNRGVVRIRDHQNNATYCQFSNNRATAIWFRKMYSQSQSNLHKQYLSTMRKLATLTREEKQDFTPFFDDRVRFILDEVEGNGNDDESVDGSVDSKVSLPAIGGSGSPLKKTGSQKIRSKAKSDSLLSALATVVNYSGPKFTE